MLCIKQKINLIESSLNNSLESLAKKRKPSNNSSPLSTVINTEGKPFGQHNTVPQFMKKNIWYRPN